MDASLATHGERTRLRPGESLKTTLGFSPGLLELLYNAGIQREPKIA
jgi:hypothetical protein